MVNVLREDLIYSRGTAIVASAWEEGLRGALDTISDFVHRELRAGVNLRLGAKGLSILPPEAKAMSTK